jgi:hypothetical protein
MKESEKMSLAKCKKGLESDGSVYTDEQVIAIRDFLYRMAEWEYEVYLKLKEREREFENKKEEDDSQLNEAA